MDFKVVLKVFVEGAHVGRDMTFDTKDKLDAVVKQIMDAHPDQVDTSANYCLHIPDPKIHPDSQWLSGDVPLSVSSTLKTGDRVELRRQPLKLAVFFAVENKNLVRSLRQAKEKVYLEPNMEIVLAIGRLKRSLGDSLPPDEYCFALMNRDQDSSGADQRFAANWINGNSTPEFYGMGPEAELLLWPLRLFMRKTAEDLKNPTCAGPMRITKKDNPSKAEKRFAVIKFNLFFSYTAPRGKTPEILANLEHYFVTAVEREGKKRFKFRLEKVMESFTPTPALYWLVFDDQETASQWNAALATECANRQGGTKLPPPRVSIPEKVPKNLFPKDPTVLPEPPHDPPKLDLADVTMPDTSAQFVAQRALAGGGTAGNDAGGSSPNVLSPMRDSGQFSHSPSPSADKLPPLASSMGAPPPPAPPGGDDAPLASAVGAAPPPPLAADVGAPAPPPPPSSAGAAPPSAPPPPLASEVGAAAPPPPLASGVGAPPPPANMPPPTGAASMPPPPSSLPPPPTGLPAPPQAPPPAPAPAASSEPYRAMYDYEAPDATNEMGERAISFKKDQMLDIYEVRPDGWCKGKNPETGEVGLVPSSFCQKA